MEGETKLCTNCKRDIAANNFVMHEMHCRRHIVLCDQCDEPIPRSELEQHFNDMHQKVPCELCKTEIEKDKMEDHMENICLKKQMTCEFCELAYAKDGMEAHVDYCGSRTECCNLCQQYVMLKDMTQHEFSGCTYPEPKPAPSLSNGTSTSPSASGVHSDPFSMSYLHDFLASDFGRVNHHVPSNVHRQPAARHGRDRPPRGGSSSNRTTSTQQNPRTRQSTRNKSNVNLERERASDNNYLGSSVDLPPDMDYDTMLAWQLTHEDMVNQGGAPNVERDGGNGGGHGLNYHWEHFSDNDTSAERQTQTDLGTEDNSMSIPCEVCHLEIPVDMYIEHTEYCWQGMETNNAADPSATTTSTSQARDRNNAMPTTSDSLRPSIPVIDNLHQSDNLHRAGPEYSPLEPSEDFLMPCEFCDEVYPSELIIQHQYVCPQNTTATPRATTPASGTTSSSRRRDRDKDNNKVRAGFPRNTNNFSSPHMSAFGGFTGDTGMTDVVVDDDDDDDDGPRSNFFRDESYKTSLQSVSDKYGGLPTTGSRTSFVPVHRSGRRNSREAEQEEGPPRTYEPARVNRSAQRARTRLDQLLQEPQSDDSRSGNHGSHGNNVNSYQRKGATASRSSNTTTGAPSNSRPRKTRVVDARTVAREISRTTHNGLTSPSLRSRVNNNSSNSSAATNNNDATFTNAPSSSNASRNRQRSDHVFSPELRPKPNDNRRR